METYLTLTEIKAHLNLDSTFTDDDNYLESLNEVCTEMVEKHICYELSNLASEHGDLPSPLRHAILLLIGHFYNNREAVQHNAAYELPLSFNYLLQLYKNYDFS